MMYRKLILLAVFVSLNVCAKAERLESLLETVPEISDIKRIDSPDFHYAYSFTYEQPVNHKDSVGKTFKQRVILQHNDFYSPIVVVMQGGMLSDFSKREPTRLLGANQIIIEHRFFDESTPSEGDFPWRDLTIYNAASDHHRIIESLKKHVYPGCKWLSTGIGKGGQAAVFHRFFYGSDVDVSVVYGAPLFRDRIDGKYNKNLKLLGRGKRNLAKIFGKNEEENLNYRIKDFQDYCFGNFDEMLALFRSEVKGKGYSYSRYTGSLDRALKYIILEYPFSYWQKGMKTKEQMPTEDNSSTKDFFEHLVKVSDPVNFEDGYLDRMLPSFYQFQTETGFYEYDIKPFQKYFPEDKKNLDFSFVLKEKVKQAADENGFNKDKMRYISKWLQGDARTMIFVYGGIDSWSCAQVNIKDNRKCYKFLCDDKGHDAEIGDFDPVTRDYIVDKLLLWMEK